jgi:leader peptidase (prepilin peptidase)/N-methyltransferase
VSSLSLFAWIGFGLGLLFGSFLNVCIARLPVHESVVRPGSRCMACGHPVRWFDNVPLVSWVVLRGRCRDCGAGISWRYPAVELATGVWFAAAAGRLVQAGTAGGANAASGAIEAIAFAVLGWLLIGLMVMDWQTQRLPDGFTLSGIAIGLGLACVQAAFLAQGEGDVVLDTTHQLRLSSPGSMAAQGNVFLTGAEALVFGRVAVVAGAALLLLGVRWAYKRLRGREGMGLGDVKLLAMIAAFLGLSQTLVALFAGVVGASVYGVALLARGRPAATTRVPFGSFLAAGGLLAAACGAQVVAWYAGLLR